MTRRGLFRKLAAAAMIGVAARFGVEPDTYAAPVVDSPHDYGPCDCFHPDKWTITFSGKVNGMDVEPKTYTIDGEAATWMRKVGHDGTVEVTECVA